MPDKLSKLYKPFKEKDEENSGDDQSDRLLAMARRQLCESYDYCFRETYRNHAINKKFALGEQWESEYKAEREKKGFPVISAPIMRPLLDRIIGNDQKIPRLSISGVNQKNTSNSELIFKSQGKKDFTLSQIYEGLIRSIEYKSRTNAAYQQVKIDQIVGNIGWLRLNYKNSNNSVFEKDLFIESIPNATQVFIDPFSEQSDGSDARYGFYLIKMPWVEFKAKYPDKLNGQPSGGDFLGVDSIDDFYHNLVPDGHHRIWSHWINTTEKTITIAEWFLRVPDKKTVYLSPDGRVLEQEAWNEFISLNEENGIKVAPIKTEQIETWKVERRVITAWSILENATDWVNDEIPFIPVPGKTLHDGVKRRYQGAVDQAVSLQQSINWSLSHYVKVAESSPKPMVFIPRGTLTEQDIDRQLHKQKTKDLRYIMYDPSPADGTGVDGPPLQPTVIDGRDAGTAELQLVNTLLTLFREQIGQLDTSGLQAASSGEQEAIQLEQQENQQGEFQRNFNIALEALYRKIIKSIPVIYDTERWLRVIDVNDAEDWIKLNLSQFGQSGPTLENNLDPEIDVRVTSAASTTSQRRNQRLLMGQFIQSGNPLLQQFAILPLMRSAEIENITQLEQDFARIAAASGSSNLLPPELFEKVLKEQQETGQLQQQIQQQIEQLSTQQAQQLAQQIVQQQLSGAEAQALLAKSQADIVKAQSDVAKTQINAQAQASKQQSEIEKSNLEVGQELLQTQQESLKKDRESVKLQQAIVELRKEGISLNETQLSLIRDSLERADQVIVGLNQGDNNVI